MRERFLGYASVLLLAGCGDPGRSDDEVGTSLSDEGISGTYRTNAQIEGGGLCKPDPQG